MKKINYQTSLLFKSFFLSSAIICSALTFTSCSKETADNIAPQDNDASGARIAGANNGDVIEGKYIVVFKQEESIGIALSTLYNDRVKAVKSHASHILQEKGIKVDAIEHTYGKAIKGFSAALSSTEAARLKNDSRIAYIEPDHVVKLAKPGSGGGTQPSQVTPYGITRVVGSITSQDRTTERTAWIIDTGIDLDHPDLNVDISRSTTFITSGRDAKTADDLNGHGSHVGGTIAARNNSIGVVGIAPGALMVAVKVLNAQGIGSYSGVIAGVDYVAANAAAGDAANMSLGGPASQALDDAVKAAAGEGIYFALAAGNESEDANNHSPARANHANIFTVSAMDSNDRWASFSNFGNPPVDFCAPGVSVRSTWKDGGYNTISGTSMAAPHVAGILLLIGSPNTDGVVAGDPDGKADAIAHLQLNAN